MWLNAPLRTSAHSAAEHGRMELAAQVAIISVMQPSFAQVVQYLLEQGADASKRNASGDMPADEADDQEIKQILRAAASKTVD